MTQRLIFSLEKSQWPELEQRGSWPESICFHISLLTLQFVFNCKIYKLGYTKDLQSMIDYFRLENKKKSWLHQILNELIGWMDLLIRISQAYSWTTIKLLRSAEIWGFFLPEVKFSLRRTENLNMQFHIYFLVTGHHNSECQIYKKVLGTEQIYLHSIAGSPPSVDRKPFYICEKHLVPFQFSPVSCPITSPAMPKLKGVKPTITGKGHRHISRHEEALSQAHVQIVHGQRVGRMGEDDWRMQRVLPRRSHDHPLSGCRSTFTFSPLLSIPMVG